MSDIDQEEKKFFIFLALVLIVSVIFALTTAYLVFSNDWASDIGNFIQDVKKASHD